jgi:hypothetical protein
MQFAPDLIIVSAGFDAAEGDPIGGCRLTPEAFSHMTALLKAVAPLALVLEVCVCVCVCVCALRVCECYCTCAHVYAPRALPAIYHTAQSLWQPTDSGNVHVALLQ